MAVHSSGHIYVSDTCRNRIFRISPVDGETKEFLSIAGPNGIAFDALESYLYVLTENPRVFCFPGPNIRGGLFRVSPGPEGKPGDVETFMGSRAACTGWKWESGAGCCRKQTCRFLSPMVSFPLHGGFAVQFGKIDSTQRKYEG